MCGDLLEGWQVPEVNPNTKVRETLESRMESEGVEALFEELRRVDAEAAGASGRAQPSAGRFGRWKLHFLARTMHIRGAKAMSGRARLPPDYDAMVVGLTMERSALYERIDARIDVQMAAGWLDEVRGLRERGYGLEHAALSGSGVRRADAAPGRGDGAQRGGAAHQVPDA